MFEKEVLVYKMYLFNRIMADTMEFKEFFLAVASDFGCTNYYCWTRCLIYRTDN